MHNQEIQFVVICASDTRTQIMQKQFTDLDLDKDFDIHYDEAITVNNSPYDLEITYSMFPETKETLCCFLSHVKAMKWYIKNSLCPFLLLLEDDAAIQKLNFKQNLLNLILKFKKTEFDYISLGYIPNTISNNLFNHPIIKKNENVYWNLYKIYLHTTWGTQAQLFPRETVKSFLNIYDKDSIKNISKSIYDYLNNNKFYYVNTPRLQIDSLNGLLKHQSIVFPPMVIELKGSETLIGIGYNNNLKYEKFINAGRENVWKNGLIQGFYKLSDYYSYNDNDNVYNINISCNDFLFQKNNISKKNIKELIGRFNGSYNFFN